MKKNRNSSSRPVKNSDHFNEVFTSMRLLLQRSDHFNVMFALSGVSFRSAPISTKFPFNEVFMKKIFGFSIISLLVIGSIIISSASLRAAQPAVDGKNIPVETGFQTLSQQELDEGIVLLFDGRSFFGWEAEPVNRNRPANLADPSITITNGEMIVKTEIPLKLRTPIYWGPGKGESAPDLSIDWKFAEKTDLKSWALLDVNKKTLVENSLNGSNAPQTGKSGEKSTFKFKSSDNGTDLANAAWFELTITRGQLTIASLRYRPGKADDLFLNIDTAWKKPAESMILEKKNQGIFLSGKGQLETVDLYSNFAVQLKFKTMVDPAKKSETFCNSGLFFRTIPGSKLDGYECQINNDPNDIDRTKFLGNDTGGIFRRVAARRITDRDNDPTWMTVIANGLTFRTWVNGIPAVVWTDSRKPDPNPRKGSKIDAGSLQIQGHDPWTKIEFLQFRVTR